MLDYIVSSFKRFPPVNAFLLHSAPEILGSDGVQLGEKCLEQSLGPVPEPNREEKSDDYSKVIVRLNDEWRVIECENGIQWILQSRKGSHKGKPAWRARAYFRSKEGLIRCVKEKIGKALESKLKELDKFPDWI